MYISKNFIHFVISIHIYITKYLISLNYTKNIQKNELIILLYTRVIQ